MLIRRVLLPLLVVAFALVVPGRALATPQFVPANGLAPSGGPADVTADRDGNAAAVWNSAGHIRLAQRPRGGAWGSSADLQPDGLASGDPQIVYLPDDELVAAWVASGVVVGARKPPGGKWSSPQTLSTSCCVALEDLVAGDNGSALAYWSSGDGSDQTAVKTPGHATFDPPQNLNLSNQTTRVALAGNGSAVAAAPGFCVSVTVPDCVRAQFRPAGGTWGNPETVAQTVSEPRGVGLAARPSAPLFTVAWGELDGSVHSADRTNAGTWTTPIDVPGAGPARTPAGCPSGTVGCLDLASRDDGLAVVWQAGTAVRGSVRAGSGGWTAVESVGAADLGDSLAEAAIAADGTPLAAWLANSGTAGAVVRGAHRAANGTWLQEPLGRTSTAQLGMGDLATDGQGDGLAGFSDVDGTRAAGFDGSGPRFTAFSLPSGGSVTFSAAAEDNWSGPAAISWAFGDGNSANGGTVDHAYGSAGTFTATATATDGVGNTTENSGPVTVTQTPPPCGTSDVDKDGINDGCDSSNGALTPIPFQTVNARVLSGEVFIKLPATAARVARKAPKGFVPLQGAETIPVGSTIDTTHGRVTIRSAAQTRRHKLQHGKFFSGRFRLRQQRLKKHSKKLLTDLRLTGSSFKKACGAQASISAKRRSSRKRVRRLFGNAKGSFRTSGRNAAATVRGTRWSVQDRCDGTLVTVQRGRVEVRDKVKRKTVFVRTGHKYLARAR